MLPLLDGMMKRPVGSDSILPVMGSQDAKMWWDWLESLVSGVDSVFVMLSSWIVVCAVLGFVLVERWLQQVWSRCPLCIAMDAGAYCRTSWDVSSGHVKWPASIAVHQVERAGEKQHAW